MITIFITTFNRPEYTVRSINSLRQQNKSHAVVLFDDNSDLPNIITSISVADPSWWVIRNNRNQGIYKQIGLISSFLTTDYLYIANNDMEYIEGFDEKLKEAQALAEKEQTVVTLYNSNKHAEIEKYDENWIWKNDIGGPSVIIKADLFREFLQSDWYTKHDKGWDWKLVEFIKQKGKRFLVSKRSYARHFGIQGINHPHGKPDHADLPIDSL